MTMPSVTATPTPESVTFLGAPLYVERGHTAPLHARTAPDSGPDSLGSTTHPFCAISAWNRLPQTRLTAHESWSLVRREAGLRPFWRLPSSEVLAYVFSHRPAPGADIRAYEDALREFHAALATTPVHGFINSTTYRIRDGYSDWYLITNSAALDALNAAAVSGARAAAHDAAARWAADGVGTLLSLTSGNAPTSAGFEIRFAKPAGTSYASLYGRLQPWTSKPRVSLWRRMMVLGPPPEFCMIAPSAIQLPPELRPEILERARI